MSVKKFLKKTEEINDELYRRSSDDAPMQIPEGDESNWLVSYADMMTLLCGFFIMLFSMAKLDQPEFEKVKEAVAKQFGGDYKSTQQEFARFLGQIIQETGIEKQAALRTDASGVSIVFQSTAFFDTLSSEIKPEGNAILAKLIDGVTTRQVLENKKFKIVVEGHTDSRPITSGIYPSNWELSGARAARVIRLFLNRGFSPDHLAAIGYADTRPESLKGGQNFDEAELAKNRRVVIRILDAGADAIPFPVPADSAH